MDRTLSQLVVSHSVCGYVFDQFQIDYCKHGERTLLSVCADLRLDPGRVLDACDSAVRQRQVKRLDPSSHTARHLLLTTVAQHHQYLHQTLPLLQQLAEQVRVMHRERQPILDTIAQTLATLATTLREHLDDEERNVFPTCLWGNASQVRDTLTKMRPDHNRILDLLEHLRMYCEDYIAPAWASSRYRALCLELAYFDADTRRHLRFENDILLPRFAADPTAIGAEARGAT